MAVAPASAAHPICAAAADTYHVAFVVRHSDGEPNRRICVEYNSSTPTFDPGTRSISGEEVLSISGVRHQAVDFGGSLGRAVCQVEKEPSQPPGGFTQKNCLGNPFWVLWTAGQGGGWSSAGSGISNQTYADGDAEGLSYGQPSPANPAGTCPPPQPKPTPSSTTSPAAVPSAGGRMPSGHGATGTPALGGATASPVPSAAIDSPIGSPTAPAPAAPATANPNRTPHKTAALGPEVAGVLAAAAAGAALLAMLVLQVLLPKLRR